MRQTRIFHHGRLAVGESTQLSVENSHYLAQVMRAPLGARITLFNGQGGEYCAQLTTIHRKACQAQLLEWIDHEVESPLHTTLLQGISKGEKMDLTIQKAVELGVNRIVPIQGQRSVVRIDAERQQKRQLHWQGIATAAACQSGRNRIPEIAPITTLAEWAHDAAAGETRLLLSPHASQGICTIQPTQQLVLLVGPEGGMAQEEVNEATSAGFQAVRFGPRVLRTETAALAALGLIQGLWGDLGH